MNSGEQLAGTLIYMNPVIGALRFQRHGDVRSVMLPFSRLFKLTLTSPVPVGVAPAAEFEAGTPTTVQTYDYRLVPAQEGRQVLAGRTAGYVQAVEGLYLFTPFHSVFSRPDAPVQVQRVFVPRSAYSAMEFGTAAQGISQGWGIADPTHLLLALEQQQRMAVAPIGHSLVKLRMVTRLQLEQALASQEYFDLPLGEYLVAARMISRADLQVALAHKMGYPMVDLRRFPIAPKVTRMLPLQTAVALRAVPLMLDGPRLIVAVDDPSRVNGFRNLQAAAARTLVFVLARGSLIIQTLLSRSSNAPMMIRGA